MKKRNVACIIVFTVAVIAVILAVCFSKRTDSETKLVFLYSYGCINVYRQSENPISLAFITKGEPMQLTESFSIAFDTSSITLKDSMIRKSFSRFGFTLWYLNLHVDVEANAMIGDTFRVKQIMLNGISYDIGEIDFKVFDERQTASYLNLKSCSGASLGAGLADYYANFENATSDLIHITKVDVPRYDDAGVAIIRDGQEEIVNNLPVSLDGASVAEVRVLLKNSKFSCHSQRVLCER